MANISKVYVGVDVSKLKLDVHLMPLNQAFSIPNDKDGIKELLKRLKPHTIGQVVCEPSGGYELAMVDMLRAKKLSVWCVEPKRIRSFIYAEGKRAKTDAIDAYMIASFASQMTNKHETNYEKDRTLHALVARKKDLTNMVSMERARLKMPQDNCKKSINELIVFMQKQIKNIEQQIESYTKSNTELNANSKLLQTVPGVGKTTAAIILAEVPELGHIGNKEAASLVGVAPHPYESGQFKGRRKACGGRYFPRSVLFMVALVASRHNSKFKKFYQRLIDAGKKPKVALGAIMRKMIVLFNVMLKNKTPWNENAA